MVPPSVLLLFLAATLCYGWKLDIVTESELLIVTGVSGAVEITNKPRAGAKMHLFLRDGVETHHLTQDNVTKMFPRVLDVRDGQHLTAYYSRDCCYRDLKWLWAVYDGGDAILSYDQTLSVKRSDAERKFEIGVRIFYLALILLAAAVLLWLKPSAKAS